MAGSRVISYANIFGSILPPNLKQPLTPQALKRLEDKGESIGISRLMMMENAGSAVASVALKELLKKSSLSRRVEEGGKLKIVCIAGTGNNGGDVFAAARHLAYWQKVLQITLFLVGDPEKIKAPEAKTNWEILAQIPAIKIIPIRSSSELLTLRQALRNANTVIVGIFGTGFHGEPEGIHKDVIETINETESLTTKISVDIPSGLNAKTGKGIHVVKSDITVTMHAPKVGMLKDRTSLRQCGKIIVANIGLPF
jgi:NAD(P)H-hydrate epimerase